MDVAVLVAPHLPQRQIPHLQLLLSQSWASLLQIQRPEGQQRQMAHAVLQMATLFAAIGLKELAAPCTV